VAAGAAIAGAGVYGQYKSGKAQAAAAGSAAEAQQAEAQATRAAAVKFALPSMAEIKANERAVALGEANIARTQRVLDSVDPALIEAGQQALKLMQGQDAQTLDPIRKERDRQKQELTSRLATQLGSGFAGSTAGIKAMNEFDNQTGQILAGAQDQALGRLLGTTIQTRSLNSPNQLVTEQQTIAGMAAAPSYRGLTALAYSPTAPYAGAPFVGAAQRAGYMNQAFGGITQIGTSIIGAAGGGKFGASMLGNSQQQQRQFGQLGQTDLGNPYGLNPYEVIT
jgi:hypothetical protein